MKVKLLRSVLKRLKKIVRQKSRDSLVLSKERIIELKGKKEELLRSKNDIETICIGSSHGSYGFYPPLFSSTSYNLCSTSQDLYYSHRLTEYCVSEIKNLKRVFLFYSVFSSGFELQKTSESSTCYLFKRYFDIPYKYDLDDSRIRVDDIEVSQNLFHQGYRLDISFMTGVDAKDRVKSHLRENRRPIVQNHYVSKISDILSIYNINLYVIIPPMSKPYRKLMPDKETLFQDILKLLIENEITLLDYYEDDDFDMSDFGDPDHLNLSGAKKMTSKMKSDFIKK